MEPNLRRMTDGSDSLKKSTAVEDSMSNKGCDATILHSIYINHFRGVAVTMKTVQYAVVFLQRF